MNKSQLFHPNHHAYRPFHITTTAIITIHDYWLEAVENGKLAVAMIDRSEAFDVVNIDILMEKCVILNLNSESFGLLVSFLCQRQQKVYISGHLSSITTLEAGVPQRSVLGSLLYTILEDMARYAGLLLGGLRPRLFLPFGQKKRLLCCFGPFLAIFGVQ